MRDFENLSAEVQQSSSTDSPIKAFFVGDNRTNVNWGRGASIALHQLLSGSFDITGSVAGELFDLSMAEAGYVRTLMPPRYYGVFRRLLLKRKRPPFSWYVKLEELLGARDFIDENPSVSVDNLTSSEASVLSSRTDIRSGFECGHICRRWRWRYHLFNSSSSADSLSACDD